MAQALAVDTDKIKSIIRSNNAIKKSTQTCVREFLDLQARFLEEVDTVYHRLDTVEHVADIFLDEEKKSILNEFEPLEQVQLAVCGYNSSGKTSFIHELLGHGDFLPAGEGAVTARIVKFSYAPLEDACLIKYNSVLDHTEVEDRVILSDCFKDNLTTKTRTKALRTLIKKHLGRPEDVDENSDEFVHWAKSLIEIRIPSPTLELGLHVYDTPGFLSSDAPVLRENLLALVASVRPTLVFLYDNATVSDDSRKCYEQLKIALHSRLLGVDIFFLNMKADVAVIRKNASNDDDDDTEDNDDEKLLEKERLYRYKLLINVDEMKHDVFDGNNHAQAPLLEQCQCFDIFSTVSPFDPMEIMMKRRAIDRIILYTAEHDLRPSKFVISIVHASIDAFFDFVLVTNRRSPDEWNKLRDDALQWGEHFFQQYRGAVERIVDEANRCLPQRFREKRQDIESRAMVDCKTRGIQLNEMLDHSILLPRRLRVDGSRYRCGLFTHVRQLCGSMKNINRDYRSEEQHFIDMLVEREVTKPVILDIISKESGHIKQSANENVTCHRNKNELLHAASRDVLMEIDNFGDIHLTIEQIVLKVLRWLLSSPALITSAVLIIPALAVCMFTKNKCYEGAQDAFDRRKKEILHYLVDLEGVLSTMGDHLKQNLIEWIKKEQKNFVHKVNGYHRVVCRTMEHRRRAYELARSYASNFARIECRLEANLNLATHHGSRPVIDRQEVLGTGGFFTVHPASWDTEHGLVAKILRDHVINQDLAYLEAHFHLTVSNLNIPHATPLKYLYEENDSSLYLLLPRYHTDLHSFLVTQMGRITADTAIQISRDIASVIAHMHAYDLVHRDIKVQNILMDEQQQVYLADFGTCQHGTENTTFVGSRPVAPEITTTPSTTSSSDRQFSYQGTTVDVYSLGMLMYACAPKDIYIPPSDIILDQLHLLDRRRVSQRYCQLITRCLNRDSKQRPTAKEIVDELDAMAKELCIVCQEAPRFGRCEPCGHKTMCVGCLAQIQQRSARPQCIMCKQVFTSVREDDDTNTFFAAASNSA